MWFRFRDFHIFNFFLSRSKEIKYPSNDINFVNEKKKNKETKLYALKRNENIKKIVNNFNITINSQESLKRKKKRYEKKCQQWKQTAP